MSEAPQPVSPPKTVVVAAMPESKPWTQSLGIIGPLVSVLAVLGGFVGVSVSPADVDIVVNAVTSGIAAVGALLGVIGRATATTKVVAPSSAKK